MGSMSVWHWLIVLLIIMMVFGTKRLKTMGSDLGAGLKGFKDGLHEGKSSSEDQPADAPSAPSVAIGKSESLRSTQSRG